MKITVLDGYTENPGDLSWDWLEALGETSIYDCTPDGLTVSYTHLTLPTNSLV